jgi:hypothetical protein
VYKIESQGNSKFILTALGGAAVLSSGCLPGNLVSDIPKQNNKTQTVYKNNLYYYTISQLQIYNYKTIYKTISSKLV